MEKIFSHAWADKHGEKENVEAQANNTGLLRKTEVDTTLLIHFFGKRGTNTLKYEDFRRHVTKFIRVSLYFFLITYNYTRMNFIPMYKIVLHVNKIKRFTFYVLLYKKLSLFFFF